MPTKSVAPKCLMHEIIHGIPFSDEFFLTTNAQRINPSLNEGRRNAELPKGPPAAQKYAHLWCGIPCEKSPTNANESGLIHIKTHRSRWENRMSRSFLVVNYFNKLTKQKNYVDPNLIYLLSQHQKCAAFMLCRN